MSEIAEQGPIPSPFVRAALDCYQAHFSAVARFDREVVGFYGSAVLLHGTVGVSDAVVVKLSKQPGRVAREIVGLERLRAHSQVAMPQVLANGTIDMDYPIEYLMLCRLPGVAPWDVAKPWANPQQTAQQVVDVLLRWHAISEPRGFELPNGEFVADFITAFEAWTAPLHHYVQSETSPFTQQQKQAYAQLWQARHRLLAPLAGMPSSLVHDDPHAGNFLFDEHSGELLAALDPCDVAFRHREQDIFHLADVAPELNLLDTYLQHYAAPAGFAARRWFFSLWDDAKHSRNLAWYDQQWFDDKFAQLAKEDSAVPIFNIESLINGA